MHMKQGIIKSAKDAFIRLLFPPRCASCNEVLSFDRYSELCEECAEKFFEEEQTVCNICKKSAADCRCSSLEDGQIPISILFYTKNAERISEKLVFSLKDDSTSGAHRFFARELSREILREFKLSDENPERWTVSFPPRSTEKRREQGFDHGEKLAKSIADFTGMTFCRLFSRTDSGEQKSLDSKGREANASETIMLSAGADVRGKKVLIADDIITTGATMNAAVRLLKSAGADTVRTASVFRTMPIYAPQNGKQKVKEPLWFE